jgi:hypothetical protein
MAKREGDVISTPGGPGIPAGTTRRDVNNPAQFGGDPKKPFVAPNVSDPRALQYAKDAEGRRRPAAAIPRYSEPVAGGSDMPIPRLDAEAIGGRTMAEQAVAQRVGLPLPHVAAASSPAAPPGGLPLPAGMGQEPALRRGIVEGTAHQAPPVAHQPRSGGLTPPPGLLPGDLLPDEAQADPMFQQGQGSMFAMNQPQLAYKYGVVRSGQRLPAQLLQQARTGPRGKPGAAPQAKLSAQTVEGLQALEAFQKQRASAESGEDVVNAAVEREAQQGPAGAAGGTAKAMTDEEKRKLLNEMDELDLSRLKNQLFKDLLNNEEQKQIIEARLSPLDLGSLVVTGRVTQLVPVVPGKFEPEFQSYSGDEDLMIKRLIGEEAKGLDLTDRYLIDKYTVMGLTIAVKAINRLQFQDYRNASGDFDPEAFWAKYRVISRFDYHMLASLTVNWFWFDMRVRQLFKAEALGNG